MSNASISAIDNPSHGCLNLRVRRARRIARGIDRKKALLPTSSSPSVLDLRSSAAAASYFLCVPKIRFCNIDGEGRQGQVVTRWRRGAQSRDGEGVLVQRSMGPRHIIIGGISA